jgi:hypothetical protein
MYKRGRLGENNHVEIELDRSEKEKSVSRPKPGSPDVQVVVNIAHEELRRLIELRADISKRINTIKRTIAGLCNLYDDDELSAALPQLATRKSGVTVAPLANRTVAM